jgi:hypothetical protein
VFGLSGGGGAYARGGGASTQPAKSTIAAAATAATETREINLFRIVIFELPSVKQVCVMQET